MSVYTTVFVGSSPIGGLLLGWIASRFGVEVSLAVGGTACILTGVLVLAWLRRIRGAALFSPAAGPTRESAGDTTRTAPARRSA